MSLYEAILILKPALSDSEAGESLEKIRAGIVQDGGTIVGSEAWGRRKLIHMIGKAREGIYLYLKYRAGSALVKKLDHQFGLNGDILRHMILRASEPIVEKSVGTEPPKAEAAVGTP
ncbi:MAG: 30S ribosomal protein S6 [Elusimicrobiota bacterium]